MADFTNALAVLRQAMENERNGYRFFLEAEERTLDPRGKGTFRNLAKDEEKHLRLLLVEHQALSAGDGWVETEEALGREIEVDITKPLFPGERLEPKAMAEFPWPAPEAAAQEANQLEADLAALKFGMDIESRFYDMYKKAAAEEDNPLGRQAYEFLMKEENRHFTLLQEAHEYLA
ncbi:MAG: ferritin family protein, partial [Anaerolineae bacterium]